MIFFVRKKRRYLIPIYYVEEMENTNQRYGGWPRRMTDACILLL
jgi:hypothetical protein